MEKSEFITSQSNASLLTGGEEATTLSEANFVALCFGEEPFAAHTDRPWLVESETLVIADDPAQFIADCESTPPECRPSPISDEDKANSQLVAASPELLKAAQYAHALIVQIREQYDLESFDSNLDITKGFDLLNGAITKAVD